MTTTTHSLDGVSRLCLGGNILGWTISPEESFAVLDAFVADGGNFIDTADSYSVWVDGNEGGESERIIGDWAAERANRDDLRIATKFGQLLGVGAADVASAVDASLRRLRTDRIDLLYAHVDDPDVPLEETLGAMNDLVTHGKAIALGASGYSADRLAEALAISEREGWAAYVAVQPHFNLIERAGYPTELQDLCAQRGLVCLPYFALARGFLTGKYRPGEPVDSRRGGSGWGGEWDDRALAVLAALDDIAARHSTTVAAVALSWLAAQPTVLAPIASARTADQMRELTPMMTLELSDEELDRLTEAGA